MLSRKYFALALLATLVVPTAGCDSDSEPEVATESSGADGSNDETTGGVTEPEERCASLDQSSCATDTTCVWRSGHVASVANDGSCSASSSGRCFSTALLDGPAGCAEEEVYAEPLPEGGAFLLVVCGETPPESMQLCGTQGAVAECGCADQVLGD